MDLQFEPLSIEIRRQRPLRLRVDAGRHITSVSGTTWVTVDGDLRDIILEPGDSHEFDRSSHVLVQALGGDARLVTEEGVDLEGDSSLAAAWRGLWRGLRRAARQS
jgi:hypothetical protein